MSIYGIAEYPLPKIKICNREYNNPKLIRITGIKKRR